MRKQIIVKVFEGEKYDFGWPPEDAIECVTWFAGKLESIPAEFRSSARIEIEAAVEYDDMFIPKIMIYYHRPETDEEMKSRSDEVIRREEAEKVREIKMLERLKAKYES